MKNIMVVVVAVLILNLWIVVVVAVPLVNSMGRHGRLFELCIFVSVLEDVAQAANIFNRLSYPEFWMIAFPIVKEAGARTEVQLRFASTSSWIDSSDIVCCCILITCACIVLIKFQS
jgi:hypothetical protein